MNNMSNDYTAERKAFEQWWRATPAWVPEFERHREWVENLCYWAWQARAALATAPSAADRLGITEWNVLDGIKTKEDLALYVEAMIELHDQDRAVPEAAGALREALRRIGELDENARREESAAVLAQAGDIARAALASAAVPHTEAAKPAGPMSTQEVAIRSLPGLFDSARLCLVETRRDGFAKESGEVLKILRKCAMAAIGVTEDQS